MPATGTYRPPGSESEFRDLRAVRDDELLERLHRELFLPSFPHPDEQEDPAAWAERLWATPQPPEPELHASVAVARDGSVAAFAFVERYRGSRSALLSYIAVDRRRRREQLAAGTFTRALDSARAAATTAGEPLRACFAEIHDPRLVADDVIDPRERLRAMVRLGARHVTVDYVQPALGPDQEPARNLLLVAFPLEGVADPDGRTVLAFLDEYFRALNVADPAADPEFSRMSEQLRTGPVLERLAIERRTEHPQLRFEDYGVALHFVAPDGEPPSRSSPEFASFEEDLLSYSYSEARGRRAPFTSRVVAVPDELRAVDLVVPGSVTFESEGEIVSLVSPEGERPRTLDVKASRTDFASRISVCHLVLVPRAADEASAIDEYDLVKLAKLWQGGEGFDAAAAVRFAWAGGEPRTASELAAAVFRRPAPEPDVRLGTIQLVTDERLGVIEWSTIWDGVASSGEVGRAEAVGFERAESGEVVAIGGIVQGLLDFEAISPDELADVFAPLDVDAEGLFGIHKGSVISIAESDRVHEQTSGTIGISPYLLLPQALLLHNEEQLDRAEQAFAGRRRDVARARAGMNRALGHYLPNVFHYAAERSLVGRGEASRGLVERRAQLAAQLAQVTASWEEQVAARREVADDVRNALLLVLAGIGLKDLLPLWAVLPAFAVVAALYIVYTLRVGTTRHARRAAAE